MGSIEPQKNTLFVFDMIRTRSHLLFRYLTTSPELYPILHPYVEAASVGPERWFYDPRIAEKGKDILDTMLPIMSGNTYEGSTKQFEENVNKSWSQGLVPFANEHIHYIIKPEFAHSLYNDPSTASSLPRNPTYIPDSIWETIQPVVLIRHPVLHVNSAFRSIFEAFKTGDVGDDFAVSTSCRFSHTLYDHLQAQGKQPIVIDGEDLLWRTEDLTKKFAAVTGLDASQIKDTWSTWPEEKKEQNPFIKMFMTTVYDSTGIQRPEQQPAEPSLEKAYQDWTSKYGEDKAKQLKGYVEASMPHYEYLLAKKI